MTLAQHCCGELVLLVISPARRVLSVPRISRAIHECDTFPTTVLQDHLNMSSTVIVRNLLMIFKRNKFDIFYYFLFVHLKKV